MIYKTYKIGTVCYVTKGTSPTLQTEPGDYPLVVTAQFRRTSNNYQLEGPAVCVPLISSTGHGHAAMHRVHYQEGKFALANLLVALQPKDSGICYSKYLYYLLGAKKDEYFVPLMQGTANMSLKERDIAGVEIQLPPFEEQRRIVARIEELAGKIEEARGLRRQTLEEAAILSRTSTASLFQEIESKAYEVYKLGNTVNVTGGGTPSKFNSEFWNGFIPWVSPKDMKVSDIYDSEDHVSEYALSSGNATLIPKDSVLLVVRSGILKRTVPVAINKTPVTINQDLKALVPKVDLLPEFLRWWVKGKEGEILNLVKGGTTVQSIEWPRALALNIAIPPIEDQRRFVKYLDLLQAKAEGLKRLQAETEKELAALLPSVLDRAFKGEL